MKCRPIIWKEWRNVWCHFKVNRVALIRSCISFPHREVCKIIFSFLQHQFRDVTASNQSNRLRSVLLVCVVGESVYVVWNNPRKLWSVYSGTFSFLKNLSFLYKLMVCDLILEDCHISYNTSLENIFVTFLNELFCDKLHKSC